MEDINFKYYIEILKSGGKIKTKKYDESELIFYINESGKLVSEDEHGLTTETGLSDIELFFVLDNAQNVGDYIVEVLSSDETRNYTESTFENDFERAVLIGKQLKDNAYDLDDIYEMYNSNQNILRYIDSLSPEVLDLFDDRNPLKITKLKQDSQRESDLNKLLDNLFDSGTIIVWDASGRSREYSIEGGMLNLTMDGTIEKIGFLAETRLEEDLEKVYSGEVEAGQILPEIVFRDEKAMEKVRFGLNTSRVFRDRLDFSVEDLDNAYESDPEFRYAVDSLDQSIWERTDHSEVLLEGDVLKDAMKSITSSEVRKYESFEQALSTEEKIDKGEL